MELYYHELQFVVAYTITNVFNRYYMNQEYT